MPQPPPTDDSGKMENGRLVRGPRSEPTYVQTLDGEGFNVDLRYTPGRGRTIDWDGERYLPEAVTKELGHFYARAIPLALVLAVACGWFAGHYWL